MPKSATTSSAKQKGGKKKKVIVPSYKEAQEAVGKGVKKFAKSHNTSESYDGHVQQGREFIACFAPAAEAEADREWKDGDDAGQRFSTEEVMPTEFQEATMDPEFPNSLDGPLSKCTPLAIAMFLTHKCINEDLGKSTAEGIHAAFKQHYKLIIGEVSSLQYKSLEFPSGPDSRRKPDGDKPHHFVLNLRNRKNWQKWEKNGEHQLGGTPEMDMYTHVLDLLDFYEYYLLGRPLEADDYIFPVLGANGASVQPKLPITLDTAQKRICAMAEAAGIRGAKDFTTHCFRRGGAQYRFMCAPQGQHWSLARIRWWSGWAISKHRDTLIRYLLDELYTYEADHSEALNPSLADVKESSAGPGTDGWPSNDVATQYNTIRSEIQAGFQMICSLQDAFHSLPSLHSHSSINYPQPAAAIPSHIPSGQVANASTMLATQASQQHIPVAQPTVSAVHDAALKLKHIIPSFPSDAKHSEHWEIVVRDWEHADPSRSLYVALKDWDPEWHKRTGLSVLYGQHEQITEEFITL
ncbi:hypothetical protein CPC08DRAFT_766691 [Agrocybe pediades]|nr:hypothetical protein CPC08DRAFT_766691 [Agrocybe pediades]